MTKKFFLIIVLLNNFIFAEVKSKIYDCFLFFNELEMLELRLNELYDYVDKFVLVESVETFRGNPKSLCFEENKHLFEKFADKIIHIIVHEHFEAISPWDREEFQRNQIMRGLKDCNPNDIIFITDADEIIRPSILPTIKQMLENMPENSCKWLLCEQNLYKYYINRFVYAEWPGTLGIYYKDLIKKSPEYYRRSAQHKRTPYIIKNAGWHFSYMGGHQRVITKLAAFSHAECDTPQNRDYKNMQNTILSLALVKIDDSYPLTIRNNLQVYIEHGFVDIR